MPSLSKIGDLSCITSCLVLPGFLMDTLLIVRVCFFVCERQQFYVNHQALINRFVWPGLLDNIFLWNDENNLFSSMTLTLMLHLSIGFSSPTQQRLTIAFNTAIATSQDERKQKVVKIVELSKRLSDKLCRHFRHFWSRQ